VDAFVNARPVKRFDWVVTWKNLTLDGFTKPVSAPDACWKLGLSRVSSSLTDLCQMLSGTGCTDAPLRLAIIRWCLYVGHMWNMSARVTELDEWAIRGLLVSALCHACMLSSFTYFVCMFIQSCERCCCCCCCCR
jgi:hypothetical protein